jgi:DNA-binding response OmpR family regulator
MSYILLIEDNQATADMIVRIFSAAGHTMRHTIRGLDGAKMARQERPSAVLLDFNLPDVDGRTMALVLKRQLGGRTAPPIIAVTARTGDGEMQVARSLGCDAFVPKPFVPEELLKLVQDLIERDLVKQAADDTNHKG